MIMKKVIYIFLIIAFLITIPCYNSFAEPGRKNNKKTLDNTTDNSIVKTVDIAVTSAVEEITTGETILLTAITPRHGSSAADTWIGATAKDIYYDEQTQSYISTAEFTAETPGEYTIIYNIVMNAGKSGNMFTGTATKTIKVTNSAVTLTGAAISNVSIIPVIRPDGSISGYSASGSLYALWSDDTSTLYGSIFFFFGPDEFEKNVTVTLYVDGKTYKYNVLVSR